MPCGILLGFVGKFQFSLNQTPWSNTRSAKKMIPREALESYARYSGNEDVASYARVDMKHWGEIASLLMQLHNVDNGQAADSYRSDFFSQLESSGVSLEYLRDLKKLIDAATEDQMKRRQSTKPRRWWKFWQ
ncbi:MAG: hypothetical protein ABSG50_11525 [Opitutaceae bacterium]